MSELIQFGDSKIVGSEIIAFTTSFDEYARGTEQVRLKVTLRNGKEYSTGFWKYDERQRKIDEIVKAIQLTKAPHE